MLNILKVWLYSAILLSILGCGSGTNDATTRSSEVDEIKKEDTDKSGTYIGTLIDAKINGVRYKSKSFDDVTANGGKFKFKLDETVKFYVGNILIGQVSKVPNDKLVFLADVLNLPRTSVDDKVIQLATFLQSLDTASENDSIIDIGGNSSKFTGSERALSSYDVRELLSSKGIAQKNTKEVLCHLSTSLKSYGYAPRSNADCGSSESGSSGSSSEGGSTGGSVDTTPPTFISSPQNGKTDVKANSDIILNFSETLKSVNADKIILSTNLDGSNPIVKNVTKSSSSVTINPSSDLTAGTMYYIIIQSGAVTDNVNNALSQKATFSFKVGLNTQTDTTAPTFVNSDQKDKTDISVSSDIVLTFSETIKSIDGSKIILATDKQGNDKIEKLSTFFGSKVTLNPTSDLLPNTKYFILIKAGGATDNYGNVLTQEASFSFTTASSSTPVTGGWVEFQGKYYKALQGSLVNKTQAQAKCLAENGTLADSTPIKTKTTEFAQALGFTKLDKDYLLKDGNYINKKFGGWTHSNGFPPSETNVYPVCEKAGSGLQDNVPPTFISSLYEGKTGVEVASDITLIFSEAIKMLYIDKIILSTSKTGINPIPTSISRSDKVVIINPDNSLTYDKTYYIIIKKGAVKDNANNELVVPKTFSFTTKSNTNPPTGNWITWNGKEYKAITQEKTHTQAVSACVNEGGTIASKAPFNNSTGGVDDAKITNFATKLNLDKTKKYWFKEDSGSSYMYYLKYDTQIFGSKKWQFDNKKGGELYFICEKSGTPSDTTPPTFVSSPQKDKTDVSISENIVLTFSEKINSVDNSKIILTKNADKSSPIVTSITNTNEKVTINPNADLETSTTYYLFIEASAVRDMKNNALTATANFTFTTKADLTPPIPTGTWVDYSSKQYLALQDSKIPKANATATCQSNGGTLAQSSSISSNVTGFANALSLTRTDSDYLFQNGNYINKKFGGWIHSNGTPPSDANVYVICEKPGSGPSDTTAPTYSSSNPTHNATEVDTSMTSLKVTYNEALKSLDKSKISLRPPSTGTLDASLSGQTITITSISLKPSTKYTLTLSEGVATDDEGNKAVAKSIIFTTKSGTISTGWEGWNGKQYKPLSEEKSHADAATKCATEGGTLASREPFVNPSGGWLQAQIDSFATKLNLDNTKQYWLKETNSLGYSNYLTYESAILEGKKWRIKDSNSGTRYYICEKAIISSKTGTLHDALVIGATYKSTSYNGTTNAKGEFEYIPGQKIEFFAGEVKIGGVQTVPSDKKVFIQDIVGVNRENVNNPQVIKIATFLQSLDSQDTNGSVVDLTVQAPNLTTPADLNDTATTVANVLPSGVTPVSENEVQDHLTASLNANGVTADTEAPTLTSEVPTKPSPSATLKVKADENLSESSVKKANVKLFESATEITDITVTLDDTKRIISIDPTNDLDSSTAYTIKITNVSDENENESNKTIDFTTADIIKPSISSSVPTNGATKVELNSAITLNISEIVIVTDSKISLYKVDGNQSVDVTITGSNTKDIVITPNANLVSQKKYKLVVAKDDLKDTSGNMLDKAFTLTFTTKDNVAPVLSEDTKNLHPNSFSYKIKANEDLNASSVKEANIKLTQNSNLVGINVVYDSKIITITSKANLASQKPYVLTLENITDLSGNKATTKTINFTTEDSESPQISSHVPVTDNAINVSITNDITITLNEEIKPANLQTTGSIKLEKIVDGGSNEDIAKTITYENKVITINPDNNLESSTKYKITILANTLEDTIGNAYETEFTLSFITEDKIKPVFKTSLPTADATEVAKNETFVLSFSEGLKIKNVNQIVLSKNSDGTSPETDAISVNLDTNTSKVKVALHEDKLEDGVVYYVYIPTTAIADMSDNALASDVSIKFTTKAPVPSCPVGFIEYPADSKECYKATNSKVEWSEAKTACETSSSILAPKAKIDTMLTDLFNNTNNIRTNLGIAKDANEKYWLEEKSGSYAYNLEYYEPMFSGNPSFRVQHELKTNYTPPKHNYICFVSNATPTVATIEPTTNATDVSTKAKIKVTFSEAMKNIVANTNVVLKETVSGSGVNLTSAILDGKILTITPESDFSISTEYTLILNPDGANAMTNAFGKELLKYESSFTTSDTAYVCDGNIYNGNCYKLLATPSSRSNAISSCQSAGGTLATNTDLNIGYSVPSDMTTTLGLQSGNKYWYNHNGSIEHLNDSYGSWVKQTYSHPSQAYPICKMD